MLCCHLTTLANGLFPLTASILLPLAWFWCGLSQCWKHTFGPVSFLPEDSVQTPPSSDPVPREDGPGPGTLLGSVSYGVIVSEVGGASQQADSLFCLQLPGDCHGPGGQQ
jgi:hypothetical protein